MLFKSGRTNVFTLKERNQLQQRIREALRANNVLQDDNVKLGSKIEELSSEVISSRALIDKLLKTSHDAQNSDWDKKEAQYRSVIRNYQQQIRKQASTVSLELYKAVVDDSKRTQTQLQDAEKKILDLQSKVTNLEKEGDTIVITKTPSNKRILMRNQLLSPTDFLEKGLLPEDYQQTQLRQSPHHDITLSAKKSRTPVSHLDINLADRMLSGRKEPDIRTRSPIEKMNLTRNDHMQSRENDRTPRPNERTIFIEEARARDDLTGMTICFQTPVTGISSPGEKTLLYPTDGSPFDMHINNWVDQYNQQNLHSAETKKGSQGATPMKSHHTTLGKHESLEHDIQSPSWNPTPLKRPVVRNFVDNDSTTPAAPPSASKENETFKTSPKSASKTLRMRKARELGGMKGMRSQLNKIRSPQSLGKPKRVAHVLGDRQLN